MALSLFTADLEAQIKASFHLDAALLALIQKISSGENVQHYSLFNYLLRSKGKLVVGPVTSLRKSITNWYHTSFEARHPGREGASIRVKRLFYWKGMSKDVDQFVKNCVVCQDAKYESIASLGLLQPLAIFDEIWKGFSIDFIIGLPKSMLMDTMLILFLFVTLFLLYK